MVRVTVTMAGPGTVTMADQGTAIMAATPLFMVATPQRTAATRPPIMVPGTTALGIIGAGDRGSAPLRARGRLVAALRPDDLVPASDALGGRGQRNDFGGPLWRREERVEKQRSRQNPEVDRSAKHWVLLGRGLNAMQDARVCRRAPSGTIRVCTAPNRSCDELGRIT
jgi:hypothetical protein